MALAGEINVSTRSSSLKQLGWSDRPEQTVHGDKSAPIRFVVSEKVARERMSAGGGLAALTRRKMSGGGCARDGRGTRYHVERDIAAHPCSLVAGFQDDVGFGARVE
jgi:hypothetical protein